MTNIKETYNIFSMRFFLVDEQKQIKIIKSLKSLFLLYFFSFACCAYLSHFDGKGGKISDDLKLDQPVFILTFIYDA